MSTDGGAHTRTMHDGTAGLAGSFLAQARWCEQAGTPLYAALLRGMAVDLTRGGIVADLCRQSRDAPDGALVHIRLLAALHEIVLAGHAPALEEYYPSVGGTASPAAVWPVAAGVLTEHADRVRAWLDVVPQTNEVGRCSALAVGLVTASALSGRRRVRLLQLGASAGLHLLVDSYRIEGEGWAWGPADSSVRLPDAVRGELLLTPAPSARADLAATVEIVQRRGCDVAPVDATTATGRRRLQAFIWPEDAERHARLAAAMEIAAQEPPVVDKADAPEWLEAQLSAPVDDDVLTVVWSSITLQFLDQARAARISALIARGRDTLPLSQIALESSGSHYVSRPRLTLDGHTLGICPAHGVPLVLRRAATS